jgi:hypothetical protein
MREGNRCQNVNLTTLISYPQCPLSCASDLVLTPLPVPFSLTQCLHPLPTPCAVDICLPLAVYTFLASICLQGLCFCFSLCLEIFLNSLLHFLIFSCLGIFAANSLSELQHVLLTDIFPNEAFCNGVFQQELIWTLVFQMYAFIVISSLFICNLLYKQGL